MKIKFSIRGEGMFKKIIDSLLGKKVDTTLTQVVTIVIEDALIQAAIIIEDVHLTDTDISTIKENEKAVVSFPVVDEMATYTRVV